jgi:hypothetical protein
MPLAPESTNQRFKHFLEALEDYIDKRIEYRDRYENDRLSRHFDDRLELSRFELTEQLRRLLP